MTRFIKSVILAIGLAVGALGMTGTASASDYCPPGYRIVCVTSYVYRQVPYTVYENRYDECGRCYQVCCTYYRTVRCAVARQVYVPCY